MVAIMLCAVYMAALQGDIVDGVRAGLGFRRSGIDQRLSGHRDFAVVSNESADDDTFPRRDVNDVSYGPITVEQTTSLFVSASTFMFAHQKRYKAQLYSVLICFLSFHICE